MPTQKEKDMVLGELRKAKHIYSTILEQVKIHDEEIKLIDKNFVKPLKEKNLLWGFTLFAQGLPYDTLEHIMRLEACIKQLDIAIEKAQKLVVTA